MAFSLRIMFKNHNVMSKKRIKLFVLIGVGLISAITLIMSREDSNDNTQIKNQVPVSQKKEDFGYDDVLKAYENAKENGQLKGRTSIETPREPTAQTSDNDNANYYEQENDPRFKAIQEEIRKMEAKRENQNHNSSQSQISTPQKTSKAESEEEYRQRLLEAREAMRKRNSDFSRAQSNANEGNTNANANHIEFRAAIYRDQFILPGERVTLLLTQPLSYKGNVFEKNTFIYATANIQQSRVLLNITNINHVSVSLQAKDLQDGELGLYSPRAGELWREFQEDAQTDMMDEGINEATQDLNIPLVGSTIKAFGRFFTRKKYKESEKIPLWNDRELILTYKPN